MQKRKDFIWKNGWTTKVKVSRAVANHGYNPCKRRIFSIQSTFVCIPYQRWSLLPSHCAVALEQVMSIGEGVDFLLALDQETVDMHGVEVRDGWLYHLR